MYTYYEALGWRGRAAGYAGIQAHPRGHIYIFSIWDHKEHTTPIRAVHRGAGTLTEKFGGEGTGLKSWNFELGWEPDTWYTLVSRAWPIGEHTFYGYWVRSGKTGQWTHLVTMDVAAKEAFFKGTRMRSSRTGSTPAANRERRTCGVAGSESSTANGMRFRAGAIR